MQLQLQLPSRRLRLPRWTLGLSVMHVDVYVAVAAAAVGSVEVACRKPMKWSRVEGGGGGRGDTATGTGTGQLQLQQQQQLQQES